MRRSADSALGAIRPSKANDRVNGFTTAARLQQRGKMVSRKGTGKEYVLANFTINRIAGP